MESKHGNVGDGDTADLDSLLDALAHERRRQTVRALQDAVAPVRLSALAFEVARRERAAGGHPDQKRVKTSLHHIHLPRLDEAGVVTYAYEDDPKHAVFSGPPEKTQTVMALLARPAE